MDIGAGKGYPSSSLSNFAGHRFFLDDVQCNSMEGFLQSLKFESIEMQKQVCLLIGKAAKFKGKPKRWYTKQVLYWRGKEIKRDSKEYQDLLDRAYQAMYDQCSSFRFALHRTGNATLTHSIGKTKINETILTRKEFCSRLTNLRDTQKVN